MYLMVTTSCSDQFTPKITVGNVVRIVNADTIQSFSIYDGKNPKVSQDKRYYYYSLNNILNSNGGYTGNVLNGEYTATSRAGQLLKKGIFKKGLKDGKWIVWEPNGNIQQITLWKNGNIKSKQVYKNGILNEKFIWAKGKWKLSNWNKRLIKKSERLELKKKNSLEKNQSPKKNDDSNYQEEKDKKGFITKISEKFSSNTPIFKYLKRKKKNDNDEQKQ